MHAVIIYYFQYFNEVLAQHELLLEFSKIKSGLEAKHSDPQKRNLSIFEAAWVKEIYLSIMFAVNCKLVVLIIVVFPYSFKLCPALCRINSYYPYSMKTFPLISLLSQMKASTIDLSNFVDNSLDLIAFFKIRATIRTSESFATFDGDFKLLKDCLA